VNKSGDPLAAGSKIQMTIEAPLRQKAFQVATIGCAPYDCSQQEGQKEIADPWVCEAPYNQDAPHAPAAAWTRPATINCSLTLLAALPPGGRTKLLSVYLDGGKPRSMCAAIAAPLNAVPANDQTCYSNPPVADYDLKVSLSPSTGLESGVGRYHTWRSLIVNTGPGAVPIERVPSHPDGAAGLVFKATLPATLIVEEVQVYGGWTCKIPEIGFGPMAAPLHAKMEFKKVSTSVPAGGATLECVYATPFEFGAGAELASDLHSSGPVYITRRWPAAVTSHCVEISSLNKGFVERADKLADNKVCWPIEP